MGGKGRRRREKNYRAAHGGQYNRLPPPPDPSQLDALPSKLRKLIPFTSQSQGSAKDSKGVPQKRKNGDCASKLKSRPKDKVILETAEIKDMDSITPRDDRDDNVKSNSNEKRKKKRKRKQIDDLRFETALENSGLTSKRRERKKKYLEARKNKGKKTKTEDSQDFPGREKIKFGDIVQAPPKLVAVPKAFKNTQDASQERVRLQAIELYRKRKGWTSRPGINLPPPVMAQTEEL